MSLPFSVAPLRVIVNLCMENPRILNLPDLDFFKQFIEHFGGKVPDNNDDEAFEKLKKPSAKASTENKNNVEEMDAESCQKKTTETPMDSKDDKSESESEESELEFDNTGVIEPDNDPPQEMGDFDLQPSEENIDEADVKRSEAMSAFSSKDYEKAIEAYTQAIKLNPQGPILYAKRGQVYIALNKPNACIRDCNRAIELNADSAAAHKFRGRANQLLGNWEAAAKDLRLACKIDFDEQADEWLRQVTPNARKIEEHKRKKERKLVEKAEKKRLEAIKKAREEAKEREKANQQFPKADDGAGKPSMSDFYQYLKDPEVLQAFQDPEVSTAFMDISTNPANILKYQKNPKIMNLINKVASKFGGGAGMPGAGGMPGFFPGAPSNPTPPGDDVGLD